MPDVRDLPLRKLRDAQVVERIAFFVRSADADEYEKVERELLRRLNSAGAECYPCVCTFPDCECS